MVLLNSKRKSKKVSLLELLLVLGIIAALVVAAFIVYPKVQASQRAQAKVIILPPYRQVSKHSIHQHPALLG